MSAAPGAGRPGEAEVIWATKLAKRMRQYPKSTFSFRTLEEKVQLLAALERVTHPAPAGDATEVERLRAELAASEDERGRMANVAVAGWLEHNRLRWDAEGRARDALAMILFIGMCAGDRIAPLEMIAGGEITEREWLSQAEIGSLTRALEASRAEVSRLLTQVATLTTALDATADVLATTEGALAEARAVLRQVEWASDAPGPYSFGGERYPLCPSCGGWKPRAGADYAFGHAPDCALAAILNHQGSEP